MNNTVTERVNRFVVEYHEDMSDAHKAQYRIRGINPDEVWNLKWSFTTLEAAEKQAQKERDFHVTFCENHGYTQWHTQRVRDLGSAISVERQNWF